MLITLKPSMRRRGLRYLKNSSLHVLSRGPYLFDFGEPEGLGLDSKTTGNRRFHQVID